VVAYVPDLMDRSKVRAAFPGAVLVNRPADLAGAVDADTGLVLLDLSRPGVLEAVTALAARPDRPTARLVGFASHVDEPTLEAARRAGVDALARSVFFRRLPTLADPPG
jgi:hypothetical protein